MCTRTRVCLWRKGGGGNEVQGWKDRDGKKKEDGWGGGGGGLLVISAEEDNGRGTHCNGCHVVPSLHN